MLALFFFVSTFQCSAHLFPLFSFGKFVLKIRRRTKVCSFWDYKYIGTSKSTAPMWNNKFIYFVPFLCSITTDICDELEEICKLEAEGALLFQKPVDEIKQVC